MLSRKIYINHFLYEFYPFLYFIFGTVLYLAMSESGFSRVIILTTFFGSGFVALMMRSKHRGHTGREVSSSDKRFWLPRLLYEIIPFFYILLGTVLLIETRNIIVFCFALAVFCTGVYFVLTRIMHRLFLS